MKKIISTLLISLLGAVLALIIHNFYFNHSVDLKLNKEDNVVNISYNPNSKNNSLKSVDFVEAAEKTIHSVVHVKNTSVTGSNSSVWDYFNKSERTRVGMGSGVIISKDGYIITNNHVIENADEITVILADAQKKSEIMKGEGDGKRNNIFAGAFGQDPEFFAFYRAMQAYEKALIGGETSLILSPDSEFFKFFGNIKPKSN